MKSYFLNSKEGRKPLQPATLKALLPTDSEAPKLNQKGKEGEGDEAKEGVKVKVEGAENKAPAAAEPKVEVSDNKAKGNEETTMNEVEDEDQGSLYGGHDPERRVSSVEAMYCGGFKKSTVCTLL